jgi:hypothetical protein
MGIHARKAKIRLLAAERFAEGAGDALTELTAGGEVLARYRQAMNIRTGAGSLLAVQLRGTALGPFGIEVGGDSPVDWPPPGTPCSVRGQALVAGALEIDLRRMRPVTPPVFPALPRWEADAARSLQPYARRSPIFGDPDSALLPALTALAGLGHPCSDQALNAIAGLVGRGPGATPSGDDFLVGFFGARLRLSGDPVSLQPALGFLAETAAHRTTPLAAEFYRHLAQGRLSEPLDRLLHAIACGGDIQSAAADLARFGATSGVDTIAGIEWFVRSSSNAVPFAAF